MHLCDDIAEADVELTFFLEIGSDATEHVVLGLIASIKVSDDDSLLVVNFVEVLDGEEFFDWIFELLLSEPERR
jgi:hypothetical protein